MPKRWKYFEEVACDISRNGNNVIETAPNGEFQLGVDIDVCVICVYPADFLLSSYFVEYNVVRSEKTDSQVVCNGRTNYRKIGCNILGNKGLHP